MIDIGGGGMGVIEFILASTVLGSSCLIRCSTPASEGKRDFVLCVGGGGCFLISAVESLFFFFFFCLVGKCASRKRVYFKGYWICYGGLSKQSSPPVAAFIVTPLPPPVPPHPHTLSPSLFLFGAEA